MKNISIIASEIITSKKIKDIKSIIKIQLDGLELNLSKHGEERLYRVEDDVIKEEEILTVVKKGLKKVMNDFANGEIPNNAEILINDSSKDLNVVGRLTMRKGKDEFNVITVMRKKDFKPKSNTYVYKVAKTNIPRRTIQDIRMKLLNFYKKNFNKMEDDLKKIFTKCIKGLRELELENE